MLFKIYLVSYIYSRSLFEEVQATADNSAGKNMHARLPQVAHDAFTTMLHVQRELHNIEGLLGIETRWTKDVQEYQDIMKYIGIRTYRQCVDKLEGLIVQRLFELAKANQSATGMSIIYLFTITQSIN